MTTINTYLQEHKLSAFNDVRKHLIDTFKVNVKEKGDLYLINYDMIACDFHDPIVQEARGIILEKETNHVICHAFNKFFNATEFEYAASIDESTARYLEKADGSLIKLYCYQGVWRWASNGMIDLSDTTFSCKYKQQNKKPFKTFQDLLNDILLLNNADNNEAINYMKLDPDVSYFFELIHPYNRIVIPYTERRLVFLGARNVKTGQEYDDRTKTSMWQLPSWIDTPKGFMFDNMKACQEAAKQLSVDAEGFVVVDAQFNRVKVKGDAYVQAHHFGVKQIDDKELIASVLKGEESEIIAYQSFLKDDFQRITSNMKTVIDNVWALLQEVITNKHDVLNSRKEWVLFITSKRQQHLLVMLLALYEAQWIYKDQDLTHSENQTIMILKGNREQLEVWLKQNCDVKNWMKALKIVG